MMDIYYLKEKFKKARLSRFDTNCFNADVIGKAERMWEFEDSFAFSADDHGIKRLFYFVPDSDTLNILLDKITDGPYYLEIITRDPESISLHSAEVLSRLMRLSNADCNNVFEKEDLIRYRNDSLVQVADESDTKRINEILWNTFKPEVSHLLSDDELNEIVKSGNVSIHRNGDIDAILQVDVMPKKFYINQVVNMAEKEIIHAMMLFRLDQYRRNGGKYIYSWVEDNNTASLKFHKKYGMEHDGMWNLVFCVK